MADQNDLTTNVNIANDDNTKLVDVNTLFGVERLAVDALITGGAFQLQPFVPYTVFDATGVNVTSGAWVTLLSLTTQQGKLDFIACVAGGSGYRVRMTVDAIVSFNISMADLSSIGLSNATNVPMWVETAGKNFRYHPKTEVDFTDSLLIEVQATGSDVTIASLINYRELP